mmetsp:Transcript_23207/g.68580  ORF Transcript_23207/g.68580 Transcript_23207/m.68580 type:complete len:409 (-) Transcript_23207:80-1306(-)
MLQDLVLLLEDAHEFVHEGPVRIELVDEFLPQDRDAQILGGFHDVAHGRFHLAVHDSELRRLTRAVRPDQPDPIPRLHAPCNTLEDLLIAEGDADVLEAEGGVPGLGRFHDPDARRRTLLSDLLLQGELLLLGRGRRGGVRLSVDFSRYRGVTVDRRLALAAPLQLGLSRGLLGGLRGHFRRLLLRLLRGLLRLLLRQFLLGHAEFVRVVLRARLRRGRLRRLHPFHLRQRLEGSGLRILLTRMSGGGSRGLRLLRLFGLLLRLLLQGHLFLLAQRLVRATENVAVQSVRRRSVAVRLQGTQRLQRRRLGILFRGGRSRRGGRLLRSLGRLFRRLLRLQLLLLAQRLVHDGGTRPPASSSSQYGIVQSRLQCVERVECGGLGGVLLPLPLLGEEGRRRRFGRRRRGAR